MGLIPMLLRAMQERRYFDHMKKIELDSRKAMQAKKAQREKEKESISSIDLPQYKSAFSLDSLRDTNKTDLFGK